MTRYVAFLRAMNVGDRTVRMETLRDLFSGIGFRNVETFIASGNVIFEARSTAARELEEKIETHMTKTLGYNSAAFVRNMEELQRISTHQPFAAHLAGSAQAFNIGFCKDPLAAEAVAAVMALKTPIDDFHIHGRELYWLCGKKQSESTFSNQRFERAIQAQATLRSATTIVKLASKYRR